MMEERYHATTQNRFYPDMSNLNKNITVEAKLISQPTCNTVILGTEGSLSFQVIIFMELFHRLMF